MLKELFESTFYRTFPSKKGTLVQVDEHFYTGKFSLYDPFACSRCPVCSSGFGAKENLIVEAVTTVSCADVSQIFQYVADDTGRHCDKILADESIVALVEMTCSEERYVNDSERGKRLKARNQLINTLLMFRANSVIRSFLDDKERRYLVFSWKVLQNQATPNDIVEQGFIPFTDFADSTYSPDNVQLYDYGFYFKEIRYPDVFKWG